ncbi:MAG TPA: histidinol-phosphate transaminase [Coriobacteriia bacterium]|jgi:histidinol-phosphate aminotransferase|uniref:histidinol-phosphate transaminase n=1 Tax=Anaerosoma tenue TaxID=2933588 RepID=UPI00076C705F|nr:histidinol-phosphate transaminase [Anaerosoma tenue]KUK47726.1 MAG: Histidinol-phosphate aminotransferase [Actinobacteria bacterium 66_15]MCK8115454.1 histidinol-phosphate transaminase [Anaerosoma tenue]HAL30487.1 histidinol-phosphate transaminase [Coriobacteriia bacterium]
MERLRPPRAELADLVAYDAKDVRAEINLSANENPRNLPGEVLEKLADRVRFDIPFNRYPDPLATRLRELIAQANGLDAANVLVGNGGDEIILDIILAWGGPGRKLVDMPPTFAMYEIDARVTGTRVVEVPRNAEFEVDGEALMAAVADQDPDIVVISNPNNPTGTMTAETLLIELLNATDALVLVDEAYFEFSRQTMRPHMERHPNLAILRTFSKAFSLAGLRAGYLLAHADVVRELTKVRQPYSVNRFTQVAASLAFRERMVFEAGVRETMRNRDRLVHGLAEMSEVAVFPSEANFVLFRVEQAAAIWRDLLHDHSILVRDLSRTPGLEDCLRVTVGTEEEVDRFLQAMDEILARKHASRHFGVNATANRHLEQDR